RIFLETLAIARDDQNEASVGRELAALAECAYEQGNLELAIDRAQQSIAILRPYGDNMTLPLALLRLGKYELERNPDAACTMLCDEGYQAAVAEGRCLDLEHAFALARELSCERDEEETKSPASVDDTSYARLQSQMATLRAAQAQLIERNLALNRAFREQ